MPDVDSRLARLEQRVDDHDKALYAMTPLVTTVAVLAKDLQNWREEFNEFRTFINNRDHATQQDRKVFFRWAVGLAVAILCALIGLAGLIITSGGHP